MANYANAKEIIAANVYTNHDGQVTAEKAKTAINEVVDTLIAGGYLYAGVAHPVDAAVSPDANVFYIASEPGTYTNKGGLIVAEGEVAIFKFNGTWSKEITGAASAEKVNKIEATTPKFLFAEDSPFVKELYLTKQAIADGITHINNYNTTSHRVFFSNGTTNLANTSAIQDIGDTYKLLNIVSTNGRKLYGYILIDFTKIPSPQPTVKQINLYYAQNIDFSPTCKIVYNELYKKPADGLLITGHIPFMAGFYNYTYGTIDTLTQYLRSPIYPANTISDFVGVDNVGSSVSRYSRSYKSFWKKGNYVGYYIGGEYHNTAGEVVTSLDYDEWAFSFYVSDFPDYANMFRLPESEHVIGKYTFERGFIALGDSTTQGAGSTDEHTSWANIVNSLCEFPSFVKLAHNGATTMQTGTFTSLASEVANIPSGFDGIVTVMIGVNDVGQENPMGDADTVLAMNYADLDDTTTFAEAFRYNIETIKRNFPNAVVLVILPLSVGTGSRFPTISESAVEVAREIERKICRALSVPFVEPAIQAGISAIFGSTFWDTFMADKVHPNSAGYAKIAHWMIGKMLEFAN